MRTLREEHPHFCFRVRTKAKSLWGVTGWAGRRWGTWTTPLGSRTPRFGVTGRSLTAAWDKDTFSDGSAWFYLKLEQEYHRKGKKWRVVYWQKDELYQNQIISSLSSYFSFGKLRKWGHASTSAWFAQSISGTWHTKCIFSSSWEWHLQGIHPQPGQLQPEMPHEKLFPQPGNPAQAQSQQSRLLHCIFS